MVFARPGVPVWLLMLCANAPLFHTKASNCWTVADGAFLDPAVWNCGCDPISCDTLFIDHALGFAADAELSPDLLVIGAEGSITSTARLVLHGRFENAGTVTAHYLRLWPPGNAQNSGTIHGDVFITVMDTCINAGSITMTDSVVVGVLQYLENGGAIVTNRLYNLGNLNNVDTITATSVLSEGPLLINTGILSVATSVTTWNSLLNDGTIEADSINAMHGFTCWGCSFICGTSFINASNGVDGEFQSDGRLITRNLYNEQDATLRGPGTICISGHSENHGSLEGSLDICDATPTLTEAPYLDVNTGSFWLSVNYCEDPFCSTVGTRELGMLDMHIWPLPAENTLNIQFADGWIPRSLSLINATGNEVKAIAGPFSSTITIDRDGIAPGLYVLIARDASGQIVASHKITFAP